MKQPRIFVPVPLDNYELCHPVNQDGFESINVLVNGAPRETGWRPIGMRIVREDQGRKLTESDSPWFGSHALIFKPRAVDALKQVLMQYGELLPTVCSGSEVSIYNPTRVLDALDEPASTVARFGGGSIMMIKHHVFRANVIDGVDVFKIPNLRVSPTFVSQRFVELWASSGLRGLEFKQVWAPD